MQKEQRGHGESGKCPQKAEKDQETLTLANRMCCLVGCSPKAHQKEVLKNQIHKQKVCSRGHPLHVLHSTILKQHGQNLKFFGMSMTTCLLHVACHTGSSLLRLAVFSSNRALLSLPGNFLTTVVTFTLDLSSLKIKGWCLILFPQHLHDAWHMVSSQ